ncbi:MAG: hypothetical protein NTW17_00750 [Candidatus Pacearchaeota archaeon]|nr:hypothetical protein [Candidatus Pacearchaeota archaeon]
MGFRRFVNILFAASTLLLTSYNDILPPINIKCNESPIPSYYVAGKGSNLIDCINNNYKSKYKKVKDFIGVKDTTMPGLRYDYLPGTTIGFYSARSDVMTFDTSKVIYINNDTRCDFPIMHESAHALLNRKSQEIGNGIWTKFSASDRRNFTLSDYGLELISEGLANYTSKENKSKNNNINWPRNREEFYCGSPYNFGNYLVTNIMDEFGAIAIPFMIKNPPTGTEVFYPTEWQNRIRRLIINSQRSRR